MSYRKAFQGMRSSVGHFRLRSLLIGVGVLTVALAFVVPRFRPPSEAEARAIRIVSKRYATMYSKSPDSLKATKLPDGGWTVEATSFLSREPGGFRSVDTFRVDPNGQCHWISYLDWGSY